jgi:mannose/fructose-specific phosphotransferase system component IIA
MAAEAPEASCLLVTHGDLGAELLRVVESILGPQRDVRALSNRGLSTEDLRARVEAALSDLRPGPVFLFIDLLGGSCSHVSTLLPAEPRDLTVFSGVNLPMLLEFCHKRERLASEELAREVLNKGREGITCLAAGASS